MSISRKFIGLSVTCGLATILAACAAGPSDDVGDPEPAAERAAPIDCVLPWQYWRDHPENWPVTTLTLGSRVYTAAELQQILDYSGPPSLLVTHARYLIAAKFNVAAGADGTIAASAIVTADQMIGALVVPPVGTDQLPPTGCPVCLPPVTAFLGLYNAGILPGAPDACPGGTYPPFCGDGNVDQGEACDDGNNVDGDGCQANCALPACGDGILDPSEACDDGNVVDGDGCQANCSLPACGDGILDTGEECDDGNTASGDGCQSTCTLPRCGDGFLDRALGETCDDANLMSGDGCSDTCQLEPWPCDPMKDPTCK